MSDDTVTLKQMRESVRFATVDRAERLKAAGLPPETHRIADEVVMCPATWRDLAKAAGVGSDDEKVLDSLGGDPPRRTLLGVPVRFADGALYGRFIWCWRPEIPEPGVSA